MLYRVCSKCAKELPDKDFYKEPRGIRGRRADCSACCRKRARENKRRNKAARSLKAKEHYLENRERYIQYSRTWYRANKERAAETHRKWRANNAEYALAHGVANGMNQRAKKFGCRGHLTAQHVLWLMSYYGYKCYDCCSTEDLQLDHVKPLSYGGYNMPANLQVVCRACNLDRWNN